MKPFSDKEKSPKEVDQSQWVGNYLKEAGYAEVSWPAPSEVLSVLHAADLFGNTEERGSLEKGNAQRENAEAKVQLL